VAEDQAKQDALFVNLLLIFKSAAMQQMGKIINPLTGKVEKNLDQARFSIDTIEMLKDKTRGNLSHELERLLESTLLELRMNYVEEAEAKPGEAPAEETASPDQVAADEARPEAASESVPESEQGEAPPAGGSKTAKAGGEEGSTTSEDGRAAKPGSSRRPSKRAAGGRSKPRGKAGRRKSGKDA
jgi:hypothetical protein